MAGTIIVAIAQNGVIGVNGLIPWHYPQDLAHFRERTKGGTVIMGRVTWESIPEKFRPLRGRENIVVSKTLEPHIGAPIVARDISSAHAHAQALGKPIYWIGGSQLYRYALRVASQICVTHIPEVVTGPAHELRFFPEIDRAVWRPTHSFSLGEKGLAIQWFARTH